MSMSVTATSSTLFVSGIPADATSLTFAFSDSGTTYTDILTASIQTRTLSYSLTHGTVPSYYYRVTTGGAATNLTTIIQYRIATKGETGSSITSFSGSGSTLITPTSIRFSGNNATATSDQTYPINQALYLQATLAGAPTVTGSTTYNMILYDPTKGTGTAATTSIYVTVTTTGGSSTYTVLYRDGGTATTITGPTSLPADPSQFSFYWDAESTMHIYIAGVEIAYRVFTTAWVSARAQFTTTVYNEFASPVTIPDVRMYPTGKHGIDGTSQSTWDLTTGDGYYNMALNRATFLANNSAFQSTQIYTTKQALYLQASCPAATGSAYNVALYETNAGVITTLADATNCIFITVTGSNYTITRRDGGTSATLVSSTALPTNPTLFSIYWDGSNTAYVYAGAAEVASYRWVATWTTARASFNVTTFAASFSINDIRLYQTGKPGTDGASQSTWAITAGTANYNTGLNTATFLANTTAVQSTQTYTARQALYLQANCPAATGSAYNVALYERTPGSVNTPASAANSIYVTITGSNYTVTRRDGGTGATLVSSTALPTDPTLFSIYWDGNNTAYVYAGAAEIASYRWVATWTNARSLFDTTVFTSQFSISDIRFYPTGKPGTDGASQSTWAITAGTANYNTGLNTATFLANTTAVQSTQTYTARQALYLQANSPAATGSAYNVALYETNAGAITTLAGATNSIYVTVTGGNYTVTRRDSGASNTAAVVIVSSTALPTDPTLFSIYWDGSNTAYVYAGAAEIASYRWVTTWVTSRASFNTTAFTSQFSISDIRFYPTGKPGTDGASQSTWAITAGTANYNTGLNTSTFLANTTAVQSTQTYTARQGLYLQANCPTVAGGTTYNVALYERTPGSVNAATAATNAIYITVTGGNYIVTRRDSGAVVTTAVVLATSVALPADGMLSIYWDGVNTAYVYAGATQVATYTWVATWTIARALFDTTAFAGSFSVSDIRLYPTGKPGTDGASQSTWAITTGTANYNTGLNTATFNANTTAVQSGQTYTSRQALYLQASCPAATGSAYNVALYERTPGSVNAATAATNAIYITVTGGNYTVTRRDSGAAVTTAVSLVSSTALPTDPTLFSIYWDGNNTAYVYAGATQVAAYTWVATWTIARALFDTTAFTSQFSISDIRFYVTGRIPTATNWRLSLSNVTTGPLVLSNLTTSGTYYYITSTAFNALTLPAAPAASDTGAFWVLRNNTSAYLSISVTNPVGLPNPLVIPPSNSATIVWAGTGYVLF